MEVWVWLVALGAAVASGGNALYFWRYRSPFRRRRVGAAVMGVVSLATFAQSLFLGLSWMLKGEIPADPRAWLLAEGLVLLGCLLVTILILRQYLNHRKGG